MILDVAIVGAGPAGTTVGEQIASAGYNVLILEKASSPGINKVCGGAISKRGFACVDVDLPKQIMEKEVHKLVFHFPDEKLDIINEDGYMILDREKLDLFLAQKAIKKGAKLLTSTRVQDLFKSDGCINIYLRSLFQRRITEVKTRLAVFADGVNTLASKKFGIGFKSNPDCTALAATYYLKWPNNPIDSLEFFFSEDISPTGYGWIFPRKDLINVGVSCILSKIQRNIRLSLDNFLTSRKLCSQEIIKFGARLIPQSVPKQIYGDHMLVVGDAAGTADPISGSGIVNAIVNGKVAAKVAIQALESNTLTGDFLSRCDNAWKSTQNYDNVMRSYFLQKIALKAGINPVIYLKQQGFLNKN